MSPKSSVLLLFLLISISGICQSFIPGQSYFDTNQHIEYIAGNLPIIISAPHGGYLEPSNIPDRTCNNPTIVRDAYTQELVREMDSAIFQIFGCHPHIIINRLHRIKLDANREIVEAACADTTAELAWNAFHNFIQHARDSVMENYGKGIYLDMHGHGHAIQRLELGYLLSGTRLRLWDDTLNSQNMVDKSSLKNLALTNSSSASHAELLRGANAIGTLLHLRGYPSVPSAQDTAPNIGDPYFNGGYNTQRYGSRDSGSIDGVQIECYKNGVRDTKINREIFSDSLSLTIKDFLALHYFTNNELQNCSGVVGKATTLESKLFNLYPNPTTSFIQINALSDGIIKITDNQGQTILADYQLEKGKIRIDIEGISSGLYHVQFRTKNSLQMQLLYVY